eukprot:CAMPEP_0181257286 /NCGR_PEP_ID=MMETSP1096-20121128/50165_1 /TAXON_ID=156174 ORGANISM="Chrysochromulina ericina, Strain CCMP281" /NCGR_SAMPLE_ID=MMETSP1096 /ASSEMBLY_ACC=CAM_ASM_000453 /LENGTH=156 /DNA_ID=CAMNT_0023355597 /DNA_START=18 /DNA_END=488 /DNA_ORIENTATION=-
MTAAAADDGIEGAIKRHRERHGDDEPSDRSEAEDEKPVIVEEGEGMTKKQKRRLEAHEGRGGSLQFKSSGPGDRFRESAAQRVAEAELAISEKQQAEVEAAVMDTAAAAGGHVFIKKQAGAEKERRKDKRKQGAGGVGAKAVRNEKMLSFSMDGDD